MILISRIILIILIIMKNYNWATSNDNNESTWIYDLDSEMELTRLLLIMRHKFWYNMCSNIFVYLIIIIK